MRGSNISYNKDWSKHCSKTKDWSADWSADEDELFDDDECDSSDEDSDWTDDDERACYDDESDSSDEYSDWSEEEDRWWEDDYYDPWDCWPYYLTECHDLAEIIEGGRWDLLNDMFYELEEANRYTRINPESEWEIDWCPGASEGIDPRFSFLVTELAD
ncbi:MAG: hypothetical protein GC193_05280 [Cryomorphaceae bacterium]|nr:hypothetical protein [Cryomorphaceae bacterium]